MLVGRCCLAARSPVTSLARRRVVVTRSSRQAPELVRRLSEAGAEPIVCPTIEARPLEWFQPLDDALGQLGQCDWIVFTSANAVTALFDRAVATDRVSCLTGRSPRFAAIGPATARALADRGAAVAFVPTDHDASAMARGLPAAPGTRVLLPRSDIAPPDLPRLLRSRGIVVREVVAYCTARVPAELSVLINGGAIDAVTFTSASAAHAFIDAVESDARASTLMRGEPRPAVACLGHQTARAVRDRGWVADAVAINHTLEGLLDVLADHFAGHAARSRA